MRALNLLVTFFVLSAHVLCGQPQDAGHNTNLRGVSVTRSPGSRQQVIWASGSNGVILRSTDSGATWKQLLIAGAADLDFRGIVGFGEEIAFVMSSGGAEKSRIYKTIDGGLTWIQQYSDGRPQFFLDSLVCESSTRCFALSDPVDGKFVILRTNDGTRWEELPRDRMPATLPDEGAFAASNSSLAICDRGKNIYFGTGGGSHARVFHSRDRGLSWTTADTPIESGNPSSGVFSIACSGRVAIAVGGDYKDMAKANRSAYSTDFGAGWTLINPSIGGYRSAVSTFSLKNFFAVGPNGADICRFQDRKNIGCERSDKLNLNAVTFVGKHGWAVGPKGSIYELSPGSLDPILRH